MNNSIRKLFLSLSFVAAVSVSWAADWPGHSRGIGIGGWLTNYKRFNVLREERRMKLSPGDYEHFDTYITREDVRRIRQRGFDHVRLGFDQVVVTDESGELRERTVKKIDEFLDWCKGEKLNVVLNLHKAIGSYCDIKESRSLVDDPALEERFVALWQKFEDRYHDRKDVAFELLNELRDVSSEKWNALADRAIAAIRAKNPDRWIVVGPTCWNNPYALPQLKVRDDPKVVYTFHMYAPWEFTHQKSVLQEDALYYNRTLEYPTDDVDRYRGFHEWCSGGANTNAYAGVKRIDIFELERQLKDAVEFSRNHPDKILWLGEFGTIVNAPHGSRVAYMKDVVTLAKSHGWPWCVWNYLSTPNDGNRFSLVSEGRRDFPGDLLNACLGRSHVTNLPPFAAGEYVIEVKSTLDGSMQPSFLYVPRNRPADGKMPLVVTFHSWSVSYDSGSPFGFFRDRAEKNGWIVVQPHFRGANSNPNATGSDKAVQDVVDAIEFVKARFPVDESRIYGVGGSGGGYMAMLQAGRHPEIWAAVHAACGISDIAAWHDEKDPEKSRYADMIRRSCGGRPAEKPEEYAHRSALTHLKGAASVPLDILHGINDPVVSVKHSLRAFNLLAAPADRLSGEDVDFIVRKRTMPPHLAMKVEDPHFGSGTAILFRRTSGNVRLTIWKASHWDNNGQAVDVFLHNRKGRPADWTVGAGKVTAPSEVTR